MPRTSEATPSEAQPSRLLLVLLCAVSLTISLGAVWLFHHSSADRSLFSLSNLVGPATRSMLHGDGLTACTDAMGTPNHPICFHAARMPLPSLVLGLSVRLLGDNYLRASFFKALLLLLPLELAIYLVWRRMRGSPSSPRSIGIALLLLAPFAITAFLANVVNLQVEEGYTYSFLALAVAILFFAIEGKSSHAAKHGYAHALLFATALDGLYLAKSAMAPAVVVLLLGYLLMERRTSQRLLVLVLVIAAPIGWALHQHHASGRYSIGTSLDGINLHKGNNPEFLNRYPPLPGDTLDRFDADLNRGLHFTNEWSFNDYHQQAALDYLRTHPRATTTGDLRKLNVLLFSIHKIGSTEDPAALRFAEIAGLLLFRLILWAAILGSFSILLRPTAPGQRLTAGLFLALVAACILPYLAGFAYTRHTSILIYPAVLMCCRMLTGDDDEASRRQSSKLA